MSEAQRRGYLLRKPQTQCHLCSLYVRTYLGICINCRKLETAGRAERIHVQRDHRHEERELRIELEERGMMLRAIRQVMDVPTREICTALGLDYHGNVTARIERADISTTVDTLDSRQREARRFFRGLAGAEWPVVESAAKAVVEARKATGRAI